MEIYSCPTVSPVSTKILKSDVTAEVVYMNVSHLVLPGDGHAACGHFAVEGRVFGLQLHSFHCGELLDVQHVFTVDGLRLQTHGRITFKIHLHLRCQD